jgi:hypothetical protein
MANSSLFGKMFRGDGAGKPLSYVPYLFFLNPIVAAKSDLPSIAILLENLYQATIP